MQVLATFLVQGCVDVLLCDVVAQRRLRGEWPLSEVPQVQNTSLSPFAQTSLGCLNNPIRRSLHRPNHCTRKENYYKGFSILTSTRISTMKGSDWNSNPPESFRAAQLLNAVPHIGIGLNHVLPDPNSNL